MVRKDLPIENVSQLNSDKLTFGESRGSNYVQVVEKTFPNAKLQKYDTFADSLQAMKVGRIDVTLDDEVLILFAGLKGNEDKFKVLKENLSPVRTLGIPCPHRPHSGPSAPCQHSTCFQDRARATHILDNG